MKKTLGPISAKLITTLKQQGKEIFSLKEAAEILKRDSRKTADLINELVKREVVSRLKPGIYLILPLEADKNYLENWFVVARELVAPHPYYISHYSAMSFHHMLTHPVLKVFVSLNKRLCGRKISGVEFKFIYQSKKKFWGWKKYWASPGEKINVSTPEKTILDGLTYPECSGGISEVAQGIWLAKGKIDYKKLIDFAQKLNIKAVIKRLGFILELYQLGGKELYRLEKLIKNDRTYVKLEPLLPGTKKRLGKWKIILNLKPETLKKVIFS